MFVCRVGLKDLFEKYFAAESLAQYVGKEMRDAKLGFSLLMFFLLVNLSIYFYFYFAILADFRNVWTIRDVNICRK